MQAALGRPFKAWSSQSDQLLYILCIYIPTYASVHVTAAVAAKIKEEAVYHRLKAVVKKGRNIYIYIFIYIISANIRT